MILNILPQLRILKTLLSGWTQILLKILAVKRLSQSCLPLLAFSFLLPYLLRIQTNEWRLLLLHCPTLSDVDAQTNRVAFDLSFDGRPYTLALRTKTLPIVRVPAVAR